jgi:hypothetical protein
VAPMSSVHRSYLTTIISFSVASLAVVAFLVFRPVDRISYELPVLENFARNEITTITIERTNRQISLSRLGTQWSVSPGNYEADSRAINFVLDTLMDFDITEVVSFSDAPKRYNLDDESRLRVTVEGSSKVLLTIDVGSRAGTFGHTFVRIPGEDRILQGVGDLRNVFDRDVDTYRNKSVLVFDPNTISAITVTRVLPPEAPRRVNVVRSLAGWGYSEDQKDLGAGLNPLDPAGIESALRFLGALPAYRYRYGDSPKGNPWLTVTLEGSQTYTLELYAEETNVFPAKSSASQYWFDMFEFQADMISKPFGF